jgi:tight adherence protein C
MDLFDLIVQVLGDDPATMLWIVVFLATSTLAFAMMISLRARGAVKRRAAGIVEDDSDPEQNNRSLRHSSMRAARRLVDYTTKHYSSVDDDNTKVLRRRLMQAGIFDPRGAAYFFLARAGLAVGLAVAAFILLPMIDLDGSGAFWLFIFVAGLAGYLAPSFYLDRQIARRRTEYQAGFPDFMDLLVVCADAGLALEAGLDRVGREIGLSYPSLSANVHMASLEIRAGRTLTDALEHFGDRLGLEEARAFATLIQQSAELGSSINDALRVYSDDMRHKRLSRAEEKAYSLPAKLTLPMMLCIFPVIFVVIMLPVVVRIVNGKY